jgi:hypothetical protein
MLDEYRAKELKHHEQMVKNKDLMENMIQVQRIYKKQEIMQYNFMNHLKRERNELIERLEEITREYVSMKINDYGMDYEDG